MAASGSGRLTIVKRDGSEGSNYQLNIGSLTLGSSKDCDIVLPSKGVSIKQCVITVHPTEARIKNLSEDISTVINAEPVTSKVLQHRDLIVLGNAKFRWEYANKAITSNASSKKNIKKSSTVVKRTRYSATRRKSEPNIKKSTNLSETKGRNSLCILPKPQSRQVAIVKPQTRQVLVPSTTVQPKNKMDNKGTDDLKILLSSGKKKKIEKVEKFDSPVILDKNKRAALFLLTKRSPQVYPLQTSLLKNTPKPKPTRGAAQSSSNSNMTRNVRELPKITNLSKTPNFKISNLVHKSVINQSKKRLSMPPKSKTAIRTPDLKNKFNTELKRKLLDASINSHPKKKDSLRSSASTPIKQLKMTPTLKLNKTKRSLTLKTPTPSPKNKNANSKNTSPSMGNSSNADAVQNNATPLLSLLSSIKTALNIMNNSEIDLEEVRRTPEFRAISNKIISVENLEKSAKSPSPNILEIGRISRSGTKSGNVTQSHVTPMNGASNSPIISPKHVTPELLDSTINNTDCNTPNLSQIFDFKSSTPMIDLNNVLNKTPVVVPRRSRKSLYQSNKKNSEILKAKSKTEPRKGFKVKININPSIHTLDFSEDYSPNNSNANDTPSTPKSSLKPPPEVLKEKHSTAKKPVSKRSLIDHLIRSPEVAKELFKSPVKRVLSQSMRHYDSHSDDSDAQNLSNSQSLIQDTSFELLTRSKRQSNNTLNSHSGSSRKSQKEKNSPLKRLSDVRGGRRSLRTPAKSNNLSDFRGVKQLFRHSPKNNLSNLGNIKKLFDDERRHNSPKNNLMNITGVKNIFKEGKAQNSPRNDLRNVDGVKELFKVTRAQKSPNNGLMNITGVKEIFKVTRNRKSPVNDLTNVSGVKSLFKKTNSPKNDLSDVGGVKELFRSNRAQKSPKNDLRNISGVEKMFQEGIYNSSDSKLQKNSPTNSSPNGSRIESLSKSLLKNRSCSFNNLSGYVSPSFASEDLIKKMAFEEQNRNFNRFSNNLYDDPRDSASPSSSVLENVGLVPSSLYKLKTENNSLNNRSRRQATINKTSFSLALSKVNMSIKNEVKPAKNNSASITCHSTPFVEPKMDISDLRQVSPISEIPNGETSPVSRTRKRKVATKRTRINVKPELVKVENADSEQEVVTERQTRSRGKNVIKPEADVSAVKTEPEVNMKKTNQATSAKSKNIKKKVTFALTDEKIELVKKEIRPSKSAVAGVLKKVAASAPKKTVKKSATASKTTAETSKKKSATKRASPTKTASVSKKNTTTKKTKSAKASSTETENKSTTVKTKLKTDSKQNAAKTKKTPTSNSKTTVKSKVKASPAKAKSQDTKKAKATKTVSKVTKSPIKKSPAKKATRSSRKKT